MLREGSYQCSFCRTVYAEYANGCPWCWFNLGAIHGLRPVKDGAND